MKAQELWEKLGGAGLVANQRFDALGAIDPAGWRIRAGPPLFARDDAKRPAAT